MKTLKEALISKDKRNWASVKDDEIYCVANYDDDLDLVGDDVMTVRSKDWVTIHILSKEAMNRHLKEIDDMLCDTWTVKDPKLSIEDVRNKIISNIWMEDLDRKLCERVYLRTVKEALITKDKRKWASKGDDNLYLVDAYNEYFSKIEILFKDKEIPSESGIRLYILTSKDIKKVLKNTNHATINMNIKDLLMVYPLTGFNEHDIELLKDDIKDEEYLENVIASYGLTAVDPTKIK